MSVSRQLVRLIRQKPIEQADMEAASKFLVDGMACSLAGAKTALGEKLSLASDDAYFLASAHAHVLEMDDLHRASVTHPGCVVVPLVWTLQAVLDLHERDVLKSILWGYEAMCRVGEALGARHYHHFHNTSTAGVFGAAMAAACMYELSEDGCVWSLGTAGTQASGLWQFARESPPADSKPVHAGNAARAGLHSVRLAQAGIRGAQCIFEGDAGFFAGYTHSDAHIDTITRAPEAPWKLTETSIKPWPSCRHTHAPIEAALALSDEASVSDASQVHVETYGAALNLCDRSDADTVFDAQFSIQHCVRAALLDGCIGQQSFLSPSFHRTLPVVTVSQSAHFEERYPDHWGASVTVDGLKKSVSDSLGDPESPLSMPQVLDKAKMMGVDVNVFQEFT